MSKADRLRRDERAEVWVIVTGTDATDPADILAERFIGDCLRDDRNPLGMARAFRTLMDSRGWSRAQLAAYFRLTENRVSRTLSLLDLPASVQALVDSGELATAIAMEIARLNDPGDQRVLAQMVISGRCGRADVMKTVRLLKPCPAKLPPKKPEPVGLDLADATVTIRWKRHSGMTAADALRKALEALRDSPAA